jgi:predicted DNA-binding ribbon-helix-helix protein
MPTIGAAVTAETKEKFEIIARSRSITASRLAASLVTSFLDKDTAENTPIEQSLSSFFASRTTDVSACDETKTKQVFVRLEPRYYTELNRMATERNWYRGTYLANLFYAHADRRPVMCDAEIGAVRQVARQLADIGRNINQIARKINSSAGHQHLADSADFELVKMLIELESNAVKALIKANLRGWGVDDDDA